jgi:DNA-binding transcriptional MocR family regulator
VVFPRHRAVAVEWLKACGLSVSPQNISLTNGATAGMTVALMSVAPPGSTVATEAIGHHTLIPLATYLGFNLEGLAIDDQGMIPEALDAACRESPIRAVFLQPSVINPTSTLMSAERRETIAAVARKHDLAIIENDVLGPLVENRPPPVAAFAPERTLYVTSFTKIVVPGLRIGYLAAPDRYVAAVANRHLVSNWMATPMVAEIATKWVADGIAMELVQNLAGRMAAGGAHLARLDHGRRAPRGSRRGIEAASRRPGTASAGDLNRSAGVDRIEHSPGVETDFLLRSPHLGAKSGQSAARICAQGLSSCDLRPKQSKICAPLRHM